jgi:hypothetical protein
LEQAAVLIPAEHGVDFYFESYKESEISMGNWLDQLIQSCDGTDGGNFPERNNLATACRLIIQGTREWWRTHRMFDLGQASFSDYLLGKVMRAGLWLNDREICCEALKSAMGQLPQPETVEVIDHFEFQDLQDE